MERGTRGTDQGGGTVWVVEGGEYEQRYISCVGRTLESAVAHLKATSTSIDRWDEVRPDHYSVKEAEGCWFSVTGYTRGYPISFNICKFDLA